MICSISSRTGELSRQCGSARGGGSARAVGGSSWENGSAGVIFTAGDVNSVIARVTAVFLPGFIAHFFET